MAIANSGREGVGVKDDSTAKHGVEIKTTASSVKMDDGVH